MLDLRVKIPSTFRDALAARFDPANAVKQDGRYRIKEPCPLCTAYAKDDSCGICPFAQGELRDCVAWLDAVIRTRVFFEGGFGIEWSREDNAVARAQLAELRKKAEKLITWI